jgi:hypothetical protein
MIIIAALENMGANVDINRDLELTRGRYLNCIQRKSIGLRYILEGILPACRVLVIMRSSSINHNWMWITCKETN